MCRQSGNRVDVSSWSNESLRLSPCATADLIAAMEQMQLLQSAKSVDAGMRNLVELLRRLRAVRQEIPAQRASE